MTPYRTAPLAPERAPWLTSWQRFAVRLKRSFFWTLAARRHAWREHCRHIEWLNAQPTGEGKVTIRADNGSVVKNVYVNHGELRMFDSLALYEYRKSGHARMPRA